MLQCSQSACHLRVRNVSGAPPAGGGGGGGSGGGTRRLWGSDQDPVAVSLAAAPNAAAATATTPVGEADELRASASGIVSMWRGSGAGVTSSSVAPALAC